MTPETLGYLLFTSGTSGAPKACLCSQGRLARIGAIVAQMYALEPADVCYLSMPLFHSNALMAGWGPALMAGSAVALPSSGRFSASGFLPDVRKAGATYFNYVGKPLSFILATPEQPDDADNPLVRAFGNEGTTEDVARFAERFGVAVTDAYGSTEGGATVQRTPDTPPGALGRAPEGTVVLDPATGTECPPARFDDHGRLLNAEEAIGELVSKAGGAGFEGYWRNGEAETARLREGWYWTGDLAYRDDAGFFYFAGRDHDWLRVDGENFASAPIERILQRHADIVLASVYAVPDLVVGDQVMAAVQLRPGVDALDARGAGCLLSRTRRPGHEMVAALRPHERRTARNGHQQGAQAVATRRALELCRTGAVAVREGRRLSPLDRRGRGRARGGRGRPSDLSMTEAGPSVRSLRAGQAEFGLRSSSLWRRRDARTRCTSRCATRTELPRRSRCELIEVIDAEALLNCCHLGHVLGEPVRSELLTLQVRERGTELVELVGSRDGAEPGEHNGILPGLVRLVHPYERSHVGADLLRIVRVHVARPGEDELGQLSTSCVLDQQRVHRAHELPSLAQHREDVTLFHGLMETFDEVVDDLGSVVDVGHGRPLSAGDAIDTLLVDEEHPLENPVLLHQVHIRRDGVRRGRRGLCNKIADLGSDHADGESNPTGGEEPPPTEGTGLSWIVWHNGRVRPGDRIYGLGSPAGTSGVPSGLMRYQ